MPNWVKNRVKMKGIGSLPLYTSEKNGTGMNEEVLDFNRLIPMPESLDVICGYTEQVAIEAVLRKLENRKILTPKYRIMTDEEFEQKARMWLERRTMEDLEKEGLKYISNTVLYGHSGWYDWRIANWGTKWNACDLCKVSDDEIEFSTAWSMPEPFMDELAKLCPTEYIEHWWADEDPYSMHCGYGNANAIGYEKGEWQREEPSTMSEALAIYVTCWGKQDFIERDEHGEWKFKKEEQDG